MATELLETIPKTFKYIYKLLGIVQFSYCKTPPKNKLSKFAPHLWCVFSYGYFINICTFYNSSNYNVKIMFYVHFLVYHGTVLLMIVLFLMFCIRSTRTKALLIRIDQNKMKCQKSTKNNRTLVRIILLGCLLTNVVFFIFLEVGYYVYISYCCVIISFENIFLNDIFDCLCDKFTLINQRLETSVTTSNQNKMDTIQDLSHQHYDLVLVTLQMSKQFETVVTVTIVQWFVAMIDSIYTATVLGVKSQVLTARFGSNFSHIVFLSCWLLVLIAKFSKTQEVANSGAIILHEVWNKHASKQSKTFHHFELISMRMFITQVRFNACGFFNLDWTFCQTVSEGFTLYNKNLVRIFR